MSATLKWEPANRKAQSLPDALKVVLRDKMSMGDGRVCFGNHSIAYLNGLRDAGVEGARELIDAIAKYGDVELWLEY